MKAPRDNMIGVFPWICIVASFSVCGCEEASVDRPAPPRLTIKDRLLGFGSIKPSVRPVRRELVLKNDGGQSLKIVSIDTGCQCLRLKTKSGEVLPGETLVGMLTLSTRKPGHNGANLTLRTNDPYNQVVVIRCTWDVEAKYQFEDSDVLLGDVRRNEVFEFSTHVVYADSGNYGDVGDAKLSIEVENGHKYAECELFKDGERVSGVRVSGVVPSVATPGAEEVVVILKDKEVVYSKLRVRWNVVQPLSVRPEKLSISGGDIDSVQVVWLETESTPKRRIGESGESLIDVNCPEGVTVDHLGRDDQWHKFGISVSPEALLLLKTGDQTVMFSSGKETVGLCLSLDTRGAR